MSTLQECCILHPHKNCISREYKTFALRNIWRLKFIKKSIYLLLFYISQDIIFNEITIKFSICEFSYRGTIYVVL